MECEPSKEVTLTEQVMEQIVGMTTSGQLKLGGELPSEGNLTELFGVTRSRMREALETLSLIGMLVIKPGDSSLVSKEGTKVPEGTVMWMYYQEMNKHDEIYAARNLIEMEVYLICYDNHISEIPERLNGFRDRLPDMETEGITTEALYQPLTGIDTYVGDACGNGIYARLMQIMVLMRKESAMKTPSLVSPEESAVFYRCKMLSSLHRDGRNKVKECLDDFFKYSIRETSIQEQTSYRMIKGQLADRQLTLWDIV